MSIYEYVLPKSDCSGLFMIVWHFNFEGLAAVGNKYVHALLNSVSSSKTFFNLECIASVARKIQDKPPLVRYDANLIDEMKMKMKITIINFYIIFCQSHREPL